MRCLAVVGRKAAAAIAALLAYLTLAGCASTLPAPLREPLPGDPGLAAVRADAAAYVGTKVRWGGQIVAVRNEATYTDIELVGRRLQSSGRPADEDQSAGRFVARLEGFVDPAIYDVGRELTVAGTLAQPMAGKVGEHLYTFALVMVESSHLWPKREPIAAYPYPYYPYSPYYPWRGPYYDPWWW